MPCMGGSPAPRSDDPTKRVEPFRRGFFSWVASDDEQLQHCESLLLRPIAGRFVQFTAGGLNSIRSPMIDASKPTVLLLHGFGGGLACWVQNWDALCHVSNVFAVDLPGMARSIREGDVCGKLNETADVVGWFNKHMESWVAEAGIPTPFVIAGHSFGAYLASHYASAHRERVRHLVLCDPWGNAVMPPDAISSMSWKRRLLVSFIFAVSPFGLVRAAGPWGASLIPRFRPDFADRWEGVLDDVAVFTDYVYHCNAKTPATGEYAFRACVQGPAYAKVPLAEFLPAHLPPSVRLSLLYGEHTWMDRDAYRAMAATMRAMRSDEDVGVHVVEGAGHQLNTDNATRFNEILVGILRNGK